MLSLKTLLLALLLLPALDGRGDGGAAGRHGHRVRRDDEKSPGEALTERLASTFQKKMAALDPVRMESVPVDWDQGGCYIRGHINNTDITGLSRASLHVEKFDPDTFTLIVTVQIPDLKGRGVMALESSICGLGQLTNSGGADFVLALTNVTSRLIANFSAVGHQVKVAHLDMSVNFTAAEFEAEDLFINPTLSKLVGKIVNSHGPELFTLMKPLLKDCVQKRFRNKMNEFLASSDLFGDAD